MTSKFEIGDIVKFKDNSKVCPDYLNNIENIYRINKIDGSQITLGRQFAKEIETFIADIEGVKMDGVEDKCIYYDPIVMASFVMPGDPAPVVHKDYTYYLDNNSTFLHEGTMRDIVDRNNFTEVHQLQHYLREIVHSDDLKINI